MAEKLRVYDVKLSIRSKLSYLQTIRSTLSWKKERLEIFKGTVFGPWLNIPAKDHDNHLLNFVLQHQRFVSNPDDNQPFMFDIGDRSYEFGREDFCLITGFRFGKVDFNPKEKDTSEFRKRVFPNVKGINAYILQDLIETEAQFGKLDDYDAVRVCLLFTLEYIFMGQEHKHMISKGILNLVDDLYKWDSFPWGEFMWSFFHKKVYNVAVGKRRQDHLQKLLKNPAYYPNFVLYGFVYALKIWSLETFSNSIHWWRKDSTAIPRGIGWTNGLTFGKSDYDRLFYDRNSFVNKLTPTPAELNERWWRSSCDYFKNVSPSKQEPRSSDSGNTKVCQVVQACKEELFGVCKEAIHVGDLDKAALLDTVKSQQKEIDDLQRRLASVEEVTKTLKPSSAVFDNVAQTFKPSDNFPLSVPNLQPIQSHVDASSKCKELVNHEYSDNLCFDGTDNQSVDGGRGSTLITDEGDNVAVDGLIQLRQSQDLCNSSKPVEDPKICEKEIDWPFNSAPMLSMPEVTQLLHDVFPITPSKGSISSQGDDCVSGLVDGEEPYEVQSVCKVVVKGDIGFPDTRLKKRRREAKLDAELNKVSRARHNPNFSSDEDDLPPLEPWREELTRHPSAPVRSVKNHEGVSSLFRDKGRNNMLWTFKWVEDSMDVGMDFWEKLVGRSHTKRGWLTDEHIEIWILYLWLFRDPNAEWAIASSYLADQLSRFEFPLYYADGLTYGVPWFSQIIHKVYFPINEKNSRGEDIHWALGELHIASGLITIYDSLGVPKGERIQFWEDFKKKLEHQFPLYLDAADVFAKKGIEKENYKISWRYAEGVPLQGGLYGDCGIWVCINLYRLSHNISLKVDDPIRVALAYREQMTEFYWKHKIVRRSRK